MAFCSTLTDLDMSEAYGLHSDLESGYDCLTFVSCLSFSDELQTICFVVAGITHAR
jgi:hypothetical protein